MIRDEVITNPKTGHRYIIFRVGYRVKLLRDLSTVFRHGMMGTIKEVLSTEVPQRYMVEFDIKPEEPCQVFGVHLYCMDKNIK